MFCAVLVSTTALFGQSSAPASLAAGHKPMYPSDLIDTIDSLKIATAFEENALSSLKRLNFDSAKGRLEQAMSELAGTRGDLNTYDLGDTSAYLQVSSAIGDDEAALNALNALKTAGKKAAFFDELNKAEALLEKALALKKTALADVEELQKSLTKQEGTAQAAYEVKTATFNPKADELSVDNTGTAIIKSVDFAPIGGKVTDLGTPIKSYCHVNGGAMECSNLDIAPGSTFSFTIFGLTVNVKFADISLNGEKPTKVAIAIPSEPPSSTTSQPPTSPSASSDNFTCNGSSRKTFDNFNGTAAKNGSTSPLFGKPNLSPVINTAGKAYCVWEIFTYQYNGGSGDSSAATFTLIPIGGNKGQAGSLGPWKVAHQASNQDFVVTLPTNSKPTVIDGSYELKNSVPSTWSVNSQSANHGFVEIVGFPAQKK